MRTAVAVWLVLAAIGPVRAQQPRGYTERVEVTRILIDARVLDNHARPLRDLGADDFRVTIGGKTARVDSVAWVPGPSPHQGLRNADAADSDATESAQPAGEPRLVVFVFQKNLEESRIVGLMRMLIEARSLLDNLTPSDRVAVLSFDTSLHIWLDFTSDFDSVRRVFHHGILFERAPAIQESDGVSLVRGLDLDRASRTYSIEGALRRVGEALERLPGAKSVILVGHGFGRFGPDGVTMENEYGDMRAALQAARASVFCLDVTEADYHSLEAGLQLVAADTGGFFARTHIFPTQALEAIAGALAGHYTLFVERPALKPGTHEIEVRLTRRKGDVFARRSYVSESQLPPR